jgi:hypothetical protein
MPLPEPLRLSLREAAQRVSARFAVSIARAKAHLELAFRDFSLPVFDRHLHAIDDWDCAVINWGESSITRRGPSVTYTIEGAMVFKEHLEHWMAPAAAASLPPDNRRQHANRTRRTQSKREAVETWLAKQYPDGSVPAGTTAKALARAFGQETSITVDERTMRRALGRK